MRRRLDSADRVALTFDDCDDEVAWHGILDALAVCGVHATFFPLGMRVEQFSAAATRTVREGHVVGSHGWDHADLVHRPLETARAWLLVDRDAWRRVAGDIARTRFRPPFGRFGPTTLAAARDAGYEELVLWDVDPRDWTCPPPGVIVEHVLRSVAAGSIVDLHVTRSTASAVVPLVEGLQARGLQPVAL